MPIKHRSPYITNLFGLLGNNYAKFVVFLMISPPVFCYLKMSGLTLHCTATVQVPLPVHIILHIIFYPYIVSGYVSTSY